MESIDVRSKGALVVKVSLAGDAEILNVLGEMNVSEVRHEVFSGPKDLATKSAEQAISCF